MTKQLVLKPQDLLVVLKIFCKKQQKFTFGGLSGELFMSASEVHSSTKRAEVAKLLRKTEEGMIPSRTSLLEFLTHGVQYVYPATFGGVTRGIPTGVAGPVLKNFFSVGSDLVPVWPDANGEIRGISFQPLYSSVTLAARLDPQLYDLLTLVDAIRGGAAREREFAKDELMRRLA
jgi:hypothetical protein